MSQNKRQEREPNEQETALLRSLVYDTLLGSHPLIRCNVEEALERLLTHIGRPKLAAVLKTI